MNAACDGEARLRSAAGERDPGQDGSAAAAARLDAWLARTETGLAPDAAACAHLPGHRLAGAWASLQDSLARAAAAWRLQAPHLDASRALARTLDEAAVFLVFGKFNAGKSSLCNFLAERLCAQGEAACFFRIEAGRIVERPGPLAEGATETTTTLQGVRLGRRLVLLDTPGLHSASAANAELTRRFTDSAEAVLWLSSSASPGQVQELASLAHELRRGKPLLPVITRSDRLEEEEVDGEIVKQLCNKPAADRLLQQEDVLLRGREQLVRMGLAPGLLHAPVSVSVMAARRAGLTAQALAEAGFDDFWRGLEALAGPARAYKWRKQAEMVLHHCQEQVMERLQALLEPALEALEQGVADEAASLDARLDRLFDRVWRRVLPELPAWLEDHAEQGDVAAVQRLLEQGLRTAVAHEARQVLAGFAAADEAVALALQRDAGADYERLPPARAGGAPQAIGHEALHAALQQAARNALQAATAEWGRRCHAALADLSTALAARRQWLQERQAQLDKLAAAIRA